MIGCRAGQCLRIPAHVPLSRSPENQAGRGEATRKGVRQSENQIGFGRNAAVFVLP